MMMASRATLENEHVGVSGVVFIGSSGFRRRGPLRPRSVVTAMAAKRTRSAPRRSSPSASRINTYIGIIVGLLVIGTSVGGWLFNAGKWSTVIDDVSKKVDIKTNELSAKIDQAAKDAQAKIDQAAKDVQAKNDLLLAKQEAANILTNTKQDALVRSIETNVNEQQTFRANVRTLLDKVFDSQQKLGEQIQQERVDRITDGKKK